MGGGWLTNKLFISSDYEQSSFVAEMTIRSLSKVIKGYPAGFISQL